MAWLVAEYLVSSAEFMGSLSTGYCQARYVRMLMIVCQIDLLIVCVVPHKLSAASGWSLHAAWTDVSLRRYTAASQMCERRDCCITNGDECKPVDAPAAASECMLHCPAV